MNKMQDYKIEKEYVGKRIDIYLADKTALTRSYIKKLIDLGHVFVNQKNIKTGYKIRAGDKIKVCFPPLKKLDLQPQEMDLKILYEDDDIVVVNKAKGVVVHPGAGTNKNTLVSGLLHHCKNLSGIGGVERPGIVHRLDKDTSGIILIAKNDKAHLNLSRQFAERKISKTYLALVHGVPRQNEGIIEKPIGRHPIERKKMTIRESGRYAKTSWKIIESFNVGNRHAYSLLEITIHTGRTHQIRVHLNSMGHPIVGDILYSKKNIKENLGLKSQFLHAYKLGFTHPRTNEYMNFTADMLPELKTILENLCENI